VTTPPRLDPADYSAALDRIHDRRRRTGDDDHRGQSEDILETLAHLRRRGVRELVCDDTGDDVLDALRALQGLWWTIRELETWFLEAGERRGTKRSDVGAVLGITRASQGVVDRIRRQREQLDRHIPPAATPQPTASEPERDDQVRTLAAGLIARRREMPEDIAGDWPADTIRDELAGWPAGTPAPHAGTITALRYLLGQLDIEIPAGHPLRELVDQGVALVGARV